MPLRYKVYYSEQALEFSLGLARKDQVLLTHFIGRLAEKPGAEGDYRQPDDEGRLVVGSFESALETSPKFPELAA